MFSRLSLAALLGGALALGSLPAAEAASTEATLYGFDGSITSPPDGSSPTGALIRDENGALYGTTINGGTDGWGIVFKLTPPAPGQSDWSLSTLHSFTCSGADGGEPWGGLVMDTAGALYGSGAVCGAGISAQGVVFKLTPPVPGQTAWTETILHIFLINETDGDGPTGSLLIDQSGTLYGATQLGGNHIDTYWNTGGVVFKLSPPGPGQTDWEETILHNFMGWDGASPQGGITAGPDGALYGSTMTGGKESCNQDQPISGCGTIFRLAPPGPGQTQWTTTTLHFFTGPDGGEPQGGLFIDQAGAIYGTTLRGGIGDNCVDAWENPIGCGVVFKLTPPDVPGQTAWTETVLHYFTGPDGNASNAGLVADSSGNLYGTASGGGEGYGVVFKLTPPAAGQTNWTESVLFSFNVSTSGWQPTTTPVLDGKDHLFGTTLSGGPRLGGVVYELSGP